MVTAVGPFGQVGKPRIARSDRIQPGPVSIRIGFRIGFRTSRVQTRLPTRLLTRCSDQLALLCNAAIKLAMQIANFKFSLRRVTQPGQDKLPTPYSVSRAFFFFEFKLILPFLWLTYFRSDGDDGPRSRYQSVNPIP